MAEPAFVFLAPGGAPRFSEAPWPLPAGEAPGAWLMPAAGHVAGAGVRACRLAHLPFWLGPELWRAELDGPVIERALEIEAPRGRLLSRVEAWDAVAAQAFAERCAGLVRELVLGALERRGFAQAAQALRACGTFAEQLRADGGKLPREGEELFGYAIESAWCAVAGRAAGAGLIAAAAHAAARGEPAAADEERAAQARWLAERLRLT